jgi:hypothetical protein
MEATTTEPRTAAEAPPKCDADGCSAPAVFNYAWDWGQKGVCCATHQFTLNQTSEALSRRVNFAPLTPAAAPPITRDERAKLMGAVYAADMEIVDLKARGSLLYAENTSLTRQVQAKSTRLTETEHRLREAIERTAELEQELEKRDAAHGDLVDEVDRLRTLAKFSEPTAPPALRESVVEGTGLVSGGAQTPPTSKSGGKSSK